MKNHCKVSDIRPTKKVNLPFIRVYKMNTDYLIIQKSKKMKIDLNFVYDDIGTKKNE